MRWKLVTVLCSLSMVFLVLALVVSYLKPDGEWKEYVFSEDGFAISSPSRLSLEKDAGANMHLYVDSLGSAAAMRIEVDDGVDVRAGSLKGKDLLALQGNVISQNEILLQGYPGFATETEHDRAHFSRRVYLVGTKRYYVTVATALNRPRPFDGATRFQDSFRLLSK